MQKGNLIVLVTCQMISATGSIVMVTLGGIIGSTLAPEQALATLPVSLMIVAVASSTVPATLLMRSIGRSKGFALASVSAVIGILVAITALAKSSFGLFIVAAMMFGINMAFTQQYRYAAAESVERRYIPRAISFVLLGAIGGAFVGPELTMRGQFWISGIPYAGTMVALAVLFTVQAMLFLFLLKGARVDVTNKPAQPARSVKEIALQPVFLVAVLGATTGYGLMTLIMTATPLSMHLNDGHSLAHTAGVIRAHVLGMYVPSLVSGFLIERFGVLRLMFAGALILMGTAIVGLQGQSVMHYWWALVLLGVGWNFLYVGGTTMLAYTYTLEERFGAQAVNEFLVFGTSATASLLAGPVMYYFGWHQLMLIPIPVLLIICIALVAIRRNPVLIEARQEERE